MNRAAHTRIDSRTPPRRRARVLIACASAALVLPLAGCHHQPHNSYPEPPTVSEWMRQREQRDREARQREEAERRPPPRPSTRSEAPAAPPVEAPLPGDLRGRPALVETGMASWYGTQYNHRRGADGNVYDENALTAAHRTLPLGTIVRVTNLANGEQVIVRITDRGPFVRGRVLDLSVGAAKAVGLYRMGIAQVKIEAFPPASASPAGAWCVQTGAFQDEDSALALKQALLRRYNTARVQEFQGPTGYWVRIDPAGHARTEAVAIQSWIGKPDSTADAYLVRLN